MKKPICYWVTLNVQEPGKEPYDMEGIHISPSQCEFTDEGDPIGDKYYRDDNIYYYLEGKTPQVGMDIGYGGVKEIITNIFTVYEGEVF